MQKITLSILLLFSIFSFGQTASVTVTQLKVRNIEATTVNFGTNVETVNVSITANVSSSYYVGKGTIMVQLKRNSSKSTAPVLPTNGADTNFVLPNGYSNTKTFTITLSRFDFDNSGGIVYVEYRPGNSSLLSFKSSNINVTKLAEPITNNTISGNQTINEGITPNIISGSLPAGGDGTYTYEWQKKNGNDWITILGTNSVSYSPENSFNLETNSYRRIIKSGGVTANVSNEVTITVVRAPVLENNTIILNGSTIYGSLPTGGTNRYQYSWVLWGGEEPYTFPQTGQNFELTKDIYDYLNLYPNLFINRIVTSGRQTITSTRVKILPLASLENNTISISGSTITGSQPTGGNNSYQYSWVLMGGEEPFTFADTGKDFEISVDTYNYLNSYPNLFIYRTVTSGNKTSGSNSIVISPAKEIGNNIITLSGNTIEGSLPTGGTGGFKYEHYIYHELPDGEVVDGVTVVGRNQSYQGVIQGYLTTKFYRKVYSGNKISTSNTITILPKGSSAKTAIASEKSVPTDVTVYPNPTTQSVNFTTNFSANKEIEITIFSEGLRETKSIFRGTVTPNQVVNWNFPANYPKGLYFYKIMADNKEVKSGKISFQ
ncbi:T9SS type A sorting domain-containing protein [Flavobacterium sp. ABG]|uniref:T9SS type A sorting domain-containing protein n=1 Tax=Flavobacterium sp. ABG TaxID=1423322 RepID=UPI000649E2B5|nr:T9SS type A sorting domain-containing protein [Flavobacterium sp. ABG]KLT70992.1 hypothetical protein AB674_04160 [Flavobacterium sp. ABG]